MKSIEILQVLRELENDSNTTHFQDAIDEFVRAKSRTTEQDLQLLKILLTNIQKKEEGYKTQALKIMKEFLSIEAFADPYYEISFR